MRAVGREHQTFGGRVDQVRWLWRGLLALAVMAACCFLIADSQAFHECLAKSNNAGTQQAANEEIASLLAAFRVFRTCSGDAIYDDRETIVAVFTVILAVSTILLWSATRDLARAAKDAAVITEQALIGLERPWLHFESNWNDFAAFWENIRPSPILSNDPPVATCFLRNFGRWPAHVTAVFCSMKASEHPPAVRRAARVVGNE